MSEGGYGTATSSGEAFTITHMLLYVSSLTRWSELLTTITSVPNSSHWGTKSTCKPWYRLLPFKFQTTPLAAVL